MFGYKIFKAIDLDAKERYSAYICNSTCGNNKIINVIIY